MSRREFNKVSSPLKSLIAEDTQEETPIISSRRQPTPDTLKDNVTAPSSSSKSLNDEEKQEETERMSSKRKQMKESNTVKYDNSLVGSKVKVWWSFYERFYEGVIASFDHVKRKHKVYYVDGDVEDLNLRRERWEFVDDVSVKNGDAEVERHDTSSDAKRQKMHGSSKSKLKDTTTESGGKSKDNVDDATIKAQKLGSASLSPMVKESGTTLTETSSSPKVKECGTALPKTTPSSKVNPCGPPKVHSIPKPPRALSNAFHKCSTTRGVTIITSDGSFKAHKDMMSANSLVFNRMRSSLTRGRKVSTVEMKEMTSESCMARRSHRTSPESSPTSNRSHRTSPESSSMTKENVKMSRREFNKVSAIRSPLKSLKAEDTQEETPRISSRRQRTPDTILDNVTSPRSSLKSLKDEEKQEETEGMSTKRKRMKESNTIKYDNSLVGSKVKVWWPSYRRFYEGVIASFDHIKRKHKVCYDDGDVEDVNLRRVRWEFVDDVSVKNGDAEVERHDTSSDAKLKDTAKESGGKSKDDGKPQEFKGKSQGDFGKASGGKSKDDGPSRNYADDAIKLQEHGGKSQNGKSPTKTSPSPMVKESGTLPKTTPSSKGGEGNSIWPTEGTLLPQATQSTLRCLSQMLNEGIHAGVTIITSDGSLKAHKSILSASSLVFHNMFQDDPSEVSTVEIKEMTSESCMALLSFLYGSLNQEGLWRHRLDLLGAASKYEIVDLKDACEQSLLEDINSGNVLERLEQAWVYQLDKLKKGCLTYLLDLEKIYDVSGEVNEFFKRADRGLLAEMFQEVLAVLKRS